MDRPEKYFIITCCCCCGGGGGDVDIPLRPYTLINQHDYFYSKCGEALHSSYENNHVKWQNNHEM